jgi:hypothetical protein
MNYLLHAPSRLDVFTTPSRTIASFLRHNHNWSAVKTERDELPSYISTSTIRELEVGTVVIDENVLDNGKWILEQMLGFLERDRFKKPDLRYVGRLNRPKQGSSATLGDGNGAAQT